VRVDAHETAGEDAGVPLAPPRDARWRTGL
jgi:hypothetical protein